MVHAAETIVKGNDFACDVGSFNQDIFVYIAAFGLFTDVSYETGQDMKMFWVIWRICWKA